MDQGVFASVSQAWSMMGGDVNHPAMPLCWSYARTSTTRQASTDKSGLARQEQALKQWLADHPDYKLQAALVDPGVSAGKGRHRLRGALGRFIRGAEAGTVPPGSVLVVESLSRFSREAERRVMGTLLNDFWSNNLGLAICGHDEIYSAELIDSQPHRLHVLLALMQQSRAEWKERSKRSLGARVAERKAQDEGVRVRSRTPFFIKKGPDGVALRDDNGCFILDPIHTATVQRAVELSLQGFGSHEISKALNREQRPCRLTARSWSDTEVRSMLRNLNITGTLVRKDGVELPNYYPQIIDRKTFDYIAKLSSARTFGKVKIGGNTTQVKNLAQSISFCSHCGGPVGVFTGGTQKGHPYEVGYARCRHSARKGTCTHKDSVRLQDWNDMVLAMLHTAQWHQLLGRPEDNKRRHDLQQALHTAEAALAEQQANLAMAEARAEQLFLQGASDAVLETASRAVTRLQEQIPQTAKAVEHARGELAVIAAQPTPEDQAELIKDRLHSYRQGLDQPENRISFNRWLTTLQPAIRFLLDPTAQTIELQVGDESTGAMPIDGPTARIALSMDGASLITRPDGSASFE